MSKVTMDQIKAAHDILDEEEPWTCRPKPKMNSAFNAFNAMNFLKIDKNDIKQIDRRGFGPSHVCPASSIYRQTQTRRNST